MNPPTGNPSFFGQKVSKPGVNVLNASPTDLVYQNDYTTTTYYDSSNSRILLGQLPDGTYGMWVSEPGVDVTSASASSGLIFDSGNDIFRIVQNESGTISVPNLVDGPFYVDTPHNLGFIPAVTAFGAPSANGQNQLWGSPQGFYQAFPVYSYTIVSGRVVEDAFMSVWVDAEKVRVAVFPGTDTAGEGTWSYNYYVLAQTATVS